MSHWMYTYTDKVKKKMFKQKSIKRTPHPQKKVPPEGVGVFYDVGKHRHITNYMVFENDFR